MTKVAFKPAARGASNVIVGLAGPSGSGKTLSALRIATGLADGGPIYFIDTERGRGLHYADRFAFQHGELNAPFRPDAYADAIDAAVAAGARVVVLDSMSHEHEGPGGLLDWHEEELDRMAGNDWQKRERVKFTAWIKPKASHNRLVNSLTQQPVHLVLCFRAKDKLALVKKDGKTEPVSIGWQPICGDRLEFECTALMVLPPNAQGVPDLTAQASKLPGYLAPILKAEQITERVGAELLRWSNGGASTATKKPAPASPSPEAGGAGAPPPQAPSAPAPKFKLPDDLQEHAKVIATALRQAKDQVARERIIAAQTKSGVLLKIKNAHADAYDWLIEQATPKERAA
jgi:hypothetical protein